MKITKGEAAAGGRERRAGASGPSPHQASEDHTAAAPDLGARAQKASQERKAQRDRAEVGPRHTGGASLGSWGGGLGGRSLELPVKMLFCAPEPRSVR